MNNKDAYTILPELLTDDSFVRWVREPKMDSNDKNWNLWMEGNSQRKALVEEARLYLEVLNAPVEKMDLGRKEALRLKILNEIEDNTSKNATSRSYSFDNKKWWYAAASVLLVFSLFSVFYFQNLIFTSNDELIVKVSPVGEIMKITLPDGSQVSLSPSSSLSFPEKFSANSRNVSLTGEGFFDVASNADKPFIVSSGKISTKVLGTQFNINASRSDQIDVSLVEGLVLVYENGNEDNQIILEPKQRAVFMKDDAIFLQKDFDENKTLAWTGQSIVFEDAGLEEIKMALERWYDIEIEYANYPEYKVALNVEFQKDPIDKILKTLSLTLGFEFSVDDKNVTIEFQGD